jgi:tetratricopeptide (TPR) repeat protein
VCRRSREGHTCREIFNDIEGALEFMNKAYRMTPPQESEDRACILTHVAHLELLAGRVDTAEITARQALELFPEYHYALAQLAKVKSKQAKHSEAADLLNRRYGTAPHPENLYELAEAYERAGKKAEGPQGVCGVRAEGSRRDGELDNSNRELIAFYLRQAKKPREALRIARMEAARRRDTATIESYASALRTVGMHKEAEKELKLLA